MRKPAIIFLSSLCIIGCMATHNNSSDKLSYRATLERNNYIFTFPKDSFAFKHREELIKQCEYALAYDLKILKLDSFSPLIRVNYYASRNDMWKYMNGRWGGVAEPWKNAVYLVCNENTKAPTIHEMMHMLCGSLWGPTHASSVWVNEGLATYSANTCNGFNVEQIYSYFLEKKMVIDMDSLSSSFYKYDDMIAYHQAAFIVQWLVEQYGIDKVKQLWQSGMEKFEKIFGISYSSVESKMNEHIRKKFPVSPDINWESFKVGCQAKDNFKLATK